MVFFKGGPVTMLKTENSKSNACATGGEGIKLNLGVYSEYFTCASKLLETCSENHDATTETGNTEDSRVAIFGAQQVAVKVPNGPYRKSANGLSAELDLGDIRKILQMYLNAGKSKIEFSIPSRAYTYTFNFNKISEAIQKWPREMMVEMFTSFLRNTESTSNNTVCDLKNRPKNIEELSSIRVDTSKPLVNGNSATTSEDNSKLESNQQDLQSEVLPAVPKSNPNNIAVTNENVKILVLGQKGDTEANGKHSTNPNNGDITAAFVQSSEPESKNTQPKSTVVHLVASKDSERADNAQGNGKQPSYPGQNNPTPQNARSKLSAIAASMLAITAVPTGIAIAVYLEMLAVGIAVGASCLVAAAIVCYCDKPKSLENSSAEAVAATIGIPLKTIS